MKRGFVVERRRVEARAPAVLHLPLPGRSAGEGDWRGVAESQILSSRIRPFAGPVEVDLTFRDGDRARNIGDLPNSCLQLLVGSKLIASAGSAVLKRLTLTWGGVAGVRVEIRQFEGFAR